MCAIRGRNESITGVVFLNFVDRYFFKGEFYLSNQFLTLFCHLKQSKKEEISKTALREIFSATLKFEKPT